MEASRKSESTTGRRTLQWSHGTPSRIQLPASGNPKVYALKLRRNLYGAKQASRGVWAQSYLTKGLIARGFVQSKIEHDTTCVC
eukprot:scaffold40797_cov63-Attheya_sp.AAC.8